MPALTRPQKITFAEMRESGVRVLIYCSDYKSSHSIAVIADRWADDVRLIVIILPTQAPAETT
jgi:hypothetical protein